VIRAVLFDLDGVLVDSYEVWFQAMNAVARRISPANTPFDGDIVFALSTGGAPARAVSHAELLTLALRAEAVLAKAIERAVPAGRAKPSEESG